jgi:hypothetical protein
VGVPQGCPPPPRPLLWLRPDTAPKDEQTQRNGQLFTEVRRRGILRSSASELRGAAPQIALYETGMGDILRTS